MTVQLKTVMQPCSVIQAYFVIIGTDICKETKVDVEISVEDFLEQISMETCFYLIKLFSKNIMLPRDDRMIDYFDPEEPFTALAVLARDLGATLLAEHAEEVEQLGIDLREAKLITKVGKGSWKVDDFKGGVSKAGRTLLIAETALGHVCGGFTVCSWAWGDDYAKASFIFSLVPKLERFELLYAGTVVTLNSSGFMFGRDLCFFSDGTVTSGEGTFRAHDRTCLLGDIGKVETRGWEIWRLC
jgi:hypothetical protein